MDKRTFGKQSAVPLAKAVLANGMLYLSGDGSIDSETRSLVPGDARDQTRRTLANLEATLVSAGSAIDKVVKATVYLTDIRDYAAMNEAYAEFFPGDPPARTTVAVAQLPVPGLLVEIELIALP
ncbi:MAG: RidA family protein [Trueperaceae bacterium]|nr:RidA family protein [Trueperaceae bacterium]